MRLALLILAIATSAYAGPQQSDPAFLGIGFDMMPSLGGCIITSITPNAPAADAGIWKGDQVTTVDDAAIHTCDELQHAIIAHRPDDTIALGIVRNDEATVITAVLATRSQVLERRVGRRIDTGAVATEPDGTRWELADRRGHALVVGTFDANCAGCIALVDRVAERLARRTPSAEMLAVVGDHKGPVTTDRVNALRGTVPLAVVDADTFDSLATIDDDRVFFMVIDGRGIVRLLAPIAPDADDIDAATDEVLAGAEQAEHARTRR